MAKHINLSTWGRDKARSRYEDGGKVLPIPFSMSKTADALQRLDSAGKLSNKSQARDFAASRAKREGYDTVKTLGVEAKYARGGAIKRADGGGVPRPSARTITTWDALNRSQGWTRRDDDGSPTPKGYESARGINEDGSDHGNIYERPVREDAPTSKRGGKVKGK